MISGTFMLGWFAGIITWWFFPRRLRAYLCGVDGPRKYGRLNRGGYQGFSGRKVADLRKIRPPQGGSGVSRPRRDVIIMGDVTGSNNVICGGDMTVNRQPAHIRWPDLEDQYPIRGPGWSKAGHIKIGFDERPVLARVRGRRVDS